MMAMMVVLAIGSGTVVAAEDVVAATQPAASPNGPENNLGNRARKMMGILHTSEETRGRSREFYQEVLESMVLKEFVKDWENKAHNRKRDAYLILISKSPNEQEEGVKTFLAEFDAADRELKRAWNAERIRVSRILDFLKNSAIWTVVGLIFGCVILRFRDWPSDSPPLVILSTLGYVALQFLIIITGSQKYIIGPLQPLFLAAFFAAPIIFSLLVGTQKKGASSKKDE
jgi:hypothetical protein